MTQALMIGMMKCSLGGVDCGSVRSGTFTAKPITKDHKSGYPPVTDLRAVQVTEGAFRVETEENVLWSKMKEIAQGLGKNMPASVEFEGQAPGLSGTALTISGTGWGSGATVNGKQEDFGTCGGESTCTDTTITGAGTTNTTEVGGVPFVQPDYTNQAITSDTDSLLYGSPKVGGDACVTASFNASGKAKYVSLAWPPTLDAAVLESSDISISGSFCDGSAALIATATTNMAPGSVPEDTGVELELSSIGATVSKIKIGHCVVLPDISFSPGNDWNGISIKATAQGTSDSIKAKDWAQIT